MYRQLRAPWPGRIEATGWSWRPQGNTVHVTVRLSAGAPAAHVDRLVQMEMTPADARGYAESLLEAAQRAEDAGRRVPALDDDDDEGD